MLRAVHFALLAPVLCLAAAFGIGLFMLRETWTALCQAERNGANLGTMRVGVEAPMQIHITWTARGKPSE